MFNYLIAYDFIDKNNMQGRGRAFCRFDHTPPTIEDIMSMERGLCKTQDFKSAYIYSFAQITEEENDHDK